MQPNGAACIVDTDCNVDFTETVGYKQWKALQDWEAAKAREVQQVAAAAVVSGNVEGSGRVLQKAREEMKEEKPIFQPFGGTAQRLGGRSVGIESNTISSSSLSSSERGMHECETKESKDGGKSGVSGTDQQSGNLISVDQNEGVELICSDGTNSASPAKDNGSAPAREEPTIVSVPAHQSRIANKFGSKKTSIWNDTSKSQPQFTGEGRALGGQMKPRNWRRQQEGPFKEEKEMDK